VRGSYAVLDAKRCSDDETQSLRQVNQSILQKKRDAFEKHSPQYSGKQYLMNVEVHTSVQAGDSSQPKARISLNVPDKSLSSVQTSVQTSVEAEAAEGCIPKSCSLMLRGPSRRIPLGASGRMLPQSSMNRMQLQFINIVQVRNDAGY